MIRLSDHEDKVLTDLVTKVTEVETALSNRITDTVGDLESTVSTLNTKFDEAAALFAIS